MLYLKLVIDRVIGSVMRRITHHARVAVTLSGCRSPHLLQGESHLATADFDHARLPDALYCGGKFTPSPLR